MNFPVSVGHDAGLGESARDNQNDATCHTMKVLCLRLHVATVATIATVHAWEHRRRPYKPTARWIEGRDVRRGNPLHCLLTTIGGAGLLG